jgi:integrase
MEKIFTAAGAKVERIDRWLITNRRRPDQFTATTSPRGRWFRVRAQFEEDRWWETDQRAADGTPIIRMEREPEGRLRWLTPEEATRLLDASRQSRNADLIDLVELALFTGMRRGELLELNWERVDRARGVVLLEVTKSGRRREVPLNSRADTVLARRGSHAHGLVFSSRNWNAYRHAFEGAATRAKLTDFRFHDLRHTFASWTVQRGATLQEVKDLLGHSTLAMVMRYAHLSPEHLRSAVARLDTALPAIFSAQASAQEVVSEGVLLRK